MNIIKVNHWSDIPKNFTVVVVCPDGTKNWYKEGNLHREDGPACEYPDGHNEWFLNGIRYTQLSLKDYVILDYHQGPYNLMWYKLLTKNQIINYPDIPGLIEK